MSASPGRGSVLSASVAHTDRLTARAAAFRRALSRWYQARARPLPWREQPTLYRTVVSEFMLQQTQVKTVLPYFDRWLRALPDFAALAAAPEPRVLKLWEGLGYYSRARNLRKLARILAARPEPPRAPDEWRALPGIGPYTAAAITSIAFGAPAAVVDGNVVRILARLTADATPHADGTRAVKAFTPLADALLNRRHPGDHNQAMMELGATVCLRRHPLCDACPVRRYCAGRRAGDPEAYPKLAPKRQVKHTVRRAWCRDGGGLLLHRAGRSARRLAGLHELPTLAQLGATARAPDPSSLLARKRRAITRHQITELIYAMPAPNPLPAGLRWVPVAQLETITLSGPHRRWVRELLG